MYHLWITTNRKKQRGNKSPIHPQLLVYSAMWEMNSASLCAVQIHCHMAGDPVLDTGTELPTVHPQESDQYPRCKYTSSGETINGSYTKYTIIYHQGRFVIIKTLPLFPLHFNCNIINRKWGKKTNQTKHNKPKQKEEKTIKQTKPQTSKCRSNTSLTCFLKWNTCRLTFTGENAYTLIRFQSWILAPNHFKLEFSSVAIAINCWV